MKAHQRQIRDEMMLKHPRPVLESLDGCKLAWMVGRENKARVRQMILDYEWLGSLPTIQIGLAVCLLDPDRELLGVALFGHGNGTLVRNVCGPEHAERHIVLERGTCAHWAPKNAASYLITHACRQVAKRGYRIFTAYADPAASEIGTVYQACNWLYIGQPLSNSRYQFKANSCGASGWISEKKQRMLRKKCGHSIPEHEAMGWERRRIPAKHRYVHFEGDKRERKQLLAALKYPILPYPKRA